MSTKGKLKGSAKVLLVVLGTLLALRLAAPSIIEIAINRSIDRAPGLAGSVGDVDLNLYRGAYQIEDIEIYTVKDRDKMPLVAIAKLELSIYWAALFDGKIAAEMAFTRPVITIVDEAKKTTDKYDGAKQETTWLSLSETVVPISIDQISVTDGMLKFLGRNKNRQGEFTVEKINGSIKNLTGRDINGEKRSAEANLSASLYGVSPAKIYAAVDVRAAKPTFDVDVSASKISVMHFDDLIKIYAPFDLEAGAFDFAMEMKAINAEIDGYLKVGVHNIDVFSWKGDIVRDNDNPFQALLDGLIGGVSALLENGDTDLVATKIPLNGKISEPDIPIFTTVANFFRNAFVEAYQMKVDDILSFGSDSESSERN